MNPSYFLSLIILLMTVLGCNNPSGNSVVQTNHTPLLKIPGPFSFSSIQAVDGKINLTWVPSSRVDNYYVYYGTSSSAVTTPVNACTGKTRTCTITGLDPDTTYYVRVDSVNASGKTSTAVVPAKSVSSFDITQFQTSNGVIDVTWSSSANATKYTVVYGTSSGSYSQAATNVTSPYRISSLNNGARYYVRVIASNDLNGYVQSTSEKDGYPIGPPPSPAGVSLYLTPGNAYLEWSPVPGSTSYKVYRGTASGSLTLISGNVTTAYFTDTTITDGTTYFYALKSNNGIDSALSPEVSGQSISDFTVTSLAVGPLANQLTITWPSVTGASGYDILYGSTPANLNQTVSNVTSPYTLTGLGASATYVQIRAKNSVGAGTTLLSTNQLNATPIDSISAPASLMANAVPGQVSLSWSAVTGASSYQLLRGTTPGSYAVLQSGLTGTSFTDTTVSNGTSYYYVVKAFNGLYSANSNEKSVKPISGFSIASASPSSSTSLLVNWSSASGADAYDLSYGTLAGTYSSQLTNVTSPYTISGLQPNQQYFITVKARNSVGNGTVIQSGEASARTKTAAPAGLTANSTPGQVSLNWADVAGASSYLIYRGTVSGSYSQLATSLSSDYIDATVANGTTYYYVVTANNGSESANSAEVAIKPVASFTISSLTAPSPTSLVLDWPVATGAATYDIKYGTTTGAYTTVLSNKTAPFTITGLLPGMTYYVVVEAKNAIGSGSTYTAPEASGKTPTGPPASIIATPVNGAINLTWTAIAGVSSYKVFRGTVSGTYSLLQANIAGTSFTDSTIIDGTTYYYVVRSYNGSDSGNSSEASAKTIAGFSISSTSVLTSSSLQVAFPATAGGDSYDLVWGTSSGTYTGLLANATSPVILNGLTPNTTYYLSIKAKNSVGIGASRNSPEVSLKTSSAAPTGLILTASPGQVGLNWSAVAGASSYKVYRGVVSGTLTEIAGNVASAAFLDTTVTDGTAYYYAVKASNGTDSALSSEVAVMPIASFNFTAASASTSTSAILNWDAASGATSYDVKYGTSSGVYLATVTNVTSPVTLNSLTPNTTYYATVVAKNSTGAGTTLSSLERNFTTSPTANSTLASQASTGQINLSWSATSGANSYNIYRGTSSGIYSQIASGVTTTSFTDSSITDGQRYYYVLRSFNGTESGNSNETSAQSVAPFTISSISSPGSTSLQVSWDAVAGATSYDVRYGTVSGSYTDLIGVSSPYTITGLSPNTTYYVLVRAKNSVGSGSSSQSPQVSQTTATLAPASLAAAFSNGTVNLSWGPVTGAISYKVYRGTSSGTYSLLASGVSSSTYSDSTGSAGTQYFYVVKAFNGSDSASSNEATILPIESFGLSSAIATSSTSLQLTWAPVSGASSYDILYGTSSGSYSTILSSQTSPKVISGLNAGATYYVVVVAKNSVGSGASVQSTEASIVTAFSAPTGLSASAAPGQVSLSWSAVAGATSYKVSRGTTSGSHTDIATNVTSTSYVDSTVSSGTQYFYVVRAYNGIDSGNSNEATVKPIASFSVTSVNPTSSSSLVITWPATSGGDQFDLLYGTASGSHPTVVTNITSPYTLSSLSPGTSYYIVVKARNSIGVGTNFVSSEVTGKTSPAAPTSLTATIASGQINLSWIATAGATAYNLYRGTSSGTYAQLATNVSGTSYVDASLINGTQYYYVVKATNGSESDASNEVTGLPLGSLSISSVTAASTSSIIVNWPSVTGAQSYDVKYGTASGTYTTTVSSVTAPYTITGLSPGTTYYIVVRAQNGIGSGTSVQSAQVSQITPIGAPTGLLATNPLTGGIALTWNAVSGASSYKVYRGTTSGAYALLASGVTGTAYSDTTASDGVSYYYVVSSYNGAESTYSAEVAKKPISSFSLTAVSAASASSLNISWSSAAGADSYDIRYGTSPGVYLWSVSNLTSPYTLTGLSSGTIYYVSIQAKNAVGTGATINSNEMNAKTAVSVPTGVAASATPGNVTVTWNSVTGATNYNVYRGTTSGSYTQIASAVTGLSYSDSTVTNGTTYYYMIRAFNGIESANSTEVSTLPMGSFTLVSAIATSSSSIALTWNSTSGASSYDVRYGTATGNYTTTLSNQISPYTVTGLSAGTRYYFSIRANNSVGAGTSLQSSELSAVTATAAPSALTATASAGKVDLSWTAPAGATSFNIYRGIVSGTYTLLTSGVNGTSYADNSITDGTTYYYIVRASNGTESINSNEAFAASVGNFSISSLVPLSSTSMTITWANASGASGYDLYYRTSPSGSYTAVANVTSPYSLATTANTTYYVKILGKNTVGAGTSTFTPELSQISPVAAPTGLVATGLASGVTLSWTAAAGATSYKIFRGTVSGTLSQIATGVSGTSYSDTGLTNGTTYYYAVKSSNGADSGLSSEVFRQPIATPAIAGITSASSTSLTVSWTGATGATTYDLKYGTSSGTYTGLVSTSSTSATISGLVSGTTYYFQLVAKNTIGGGAGTSVTSIESSGAPNSPPVISIIPDQTMEADTSLTVNFTLNDSNNLLTCSVAMSGSAANSTLVPSANITFSGAVPNCSATITPTAAQTGTTTVTLNATDLISTTSQSFALTVTPCVVDSIAWVTQPPTSTNAGSPMATAPKVKLLKADGVTLCTSNLSPVSLAIATDGSTQQDATVYSGDSVIPSGGYATFPSVVVRRAGTHTFNAIQDAVTTDLESNSFTINALTASTIVFQQHPTSNPASSSFLPAPVLRIADLYGNYVTGANTSFTLTLKNSPSGTAASGATGNTATSASGIATFSSFKVSTAGTYYVTASGGSFPSVDSTPFSVLTLTPQNTVSVIELLQGPISLSSSTTTYFDRAGAVFGTNSINGTVTWRWKIVATNTSSTSATVRLRVGTTTQGTITVPGNVTVPTQYSGTFSTTPGASSTYRMSLRNGTVTVHSAKVIAVQTNATKSQIYIPLTSLPTSASSVTTTGTSVSSSMSGSLAINFPVYDFNKTKFDRIDTADFYFVGLGTNSCASLWNRSTNTQIGSEVCASATEALSKVSLQASALPASALIEARFRSTNGANATMYKAGLMLNIVGINDVATIQRIAPAVSGLAATTVFNFQRATSWAANFGGGLVNEYVNCNVGAVAAGSGSFVLRDYGADNNSTAISTTTATSTISASTMPVSNQTQYTQLSAGPLATTSGNSLLLNYTHTSGSFNLSHCLYETQATY